MNAKKQASSNVAHKPLRMDDVDFTRAAERVQQEEMTEVGRVQLDAILVEARRSRSSEAVLLEAMRRVLMGIDGDRPLTDQDVAKYRAAVAKATGGES